MGAQSPSMVGIAGIGRMGAAIAARLLECGVPIAIWNRSPARLGELVAQGAVAFPTPAELASACDLVVTSLLNDSALDTVYLGTDGLLRSQPRHQLFIDTSTVLPATAARLAEEAARIGASFIDAPVIGTVGPARAGQLIVLAGGAASDVLRARTVFEHIARVVHHVGGVSTGSAMKLAVNIPMATYWASMAESFALARTCGLNTDQLAHIIADSPAALAQLKMKLPVLLGESCGVGFDIDGVVKDCDNTIRLAGANDVNLLVLAAARAMFREAAKAGWGNRDIATTPRLKWMAVPFESPPSRE